MAENENLDLLDLEDDTDLIDLPTADPFASAPRPKKPWLLLGVAVIVIILATYIIIRVVGGNRDDSVDIILDTPVVETSSEIATGHTDNIVVPATLPARLPADAPVVAPTEPAPTAPVRVIEDRPDVKFNPDVASAPAPKPRPAAKPVAPKPDATATAKKPITKPAGSKQVVVSGTWYVQFGSYSTRALAEAGQRKIMTGHPSLLSGKSFVILAAEVNGKTVYRLRMAFKTNSEANGFCNNAKSDGLECYVTK